MLFRSGEGNIFATVNEKVKGPGENYVVITVIASRLVYANSRAVNRFFPSFSFQMSDRFGNVRIRKLRSVTDAA